MLDLIIKLILAYLLGSVLGSLIVGRVKGRVDIRSQGSGNAGGTNALRTQGKGFAAWVMAIDIGKGALATGLVPLLPLALLWNGASYSLTLQMLACGAAAVVGHVYPLWYGFQGGKGAATLLGVLAVAAPWLLPPVLLVFILVLVLTGFVGLSTVLAAASTIAWVWVAKAVGWVATAGFGSPLFWFAIAMAVLIAYTHRSNLQRLASGTEHRFEKALMFKRKA